VREVLGSSFTGNWAQIQAEFARRIRLAVGHKAFRPVTDKPATDADRAKVPRASGPLRLMPELATAIEALLEPFEGEELVRKQAAVLKVYGSPVEGPFATILAAYRAAIEAA
jgi:hypothetical protein